MRSAPGVVTHLLPGANEVAKPWKPDRLVEAVLNEPAAWAAVVTEAPENLVQLRREVCSAFNAWQARVMAVRDVAFCLAHT